MKHLPLILAALITLCVSPSFAGSSEREMLMLMDIPVVVTASKTEQPINEAPATIEVITDKDIARYGFRTVAEVLRMVPGMDIASVGFSVYFSPRGLNGRKTNTTVLFLIDGHAINDLPRGVVDPCGLQLTNVKRIEVIRGPGSSLYGTNAFAGVVNIITKSAADAPRPRAAFGKGNFDNTLVSVEAGIRAGNIDAYVSVDKLSTDAMDGHAIDDNEDRDDRQYFGKMRAGELSLFWYRSTLDAGIPSTVTANQRGSTSQDITALDWDHPLSERTSVKVLSHVMLNTIDMIQQPAGMLSADSMGSAVEVQLHSRLSSRNTLVAGAELKNDRTDAPSLSLDKRSIDTRAAYLQDEWRLSDRVIFTAGGRYDIPSGFDSVFSPRVNLAYKFSDRTVAKAAYGEAFRAPTMLETYASFDLIPGFVEFRGNPDLKPEMIHSTELGISHIASADTRFSLNLFKIKTINAIDFSASFAGFTSIYRYVNKSSAEVTGGEATVSHRLAACWESVFSYAYQYARDADTGGELADAPRYKFTLQNCLTPAERLTLSTVTWYTGERDTIWENQRRSNKPPVCVTNAHAAYVCGEHLTLSCSAKNIFNNSYAEFDTFPVIGVSYRVDAAYRF